MFTHDDVEKALANAGLAGMKITSPIKVVIEDCLAGLITLDEMVERVKAYEMIMSAYAEREKAEAAQDQPPPA